MKRNLVILIFLLATEQVLSNAFPKCEAACSKYYDCVVQAQPKASEEQKDLLRKGCNANCNKAKYYPKIEKCYDKSQGSCTAYWNCITKAMQ
jgi:Cys-rich protein (TIGR04453 family)